METRGVRVRFSSPAHENRCWWTILECDGRYVVCVRERLALPDGLLAYTVAGLALAPSAMAAGATITLNGADGNSLAGHTFNVYQIGTYTDQILNGTQISSLGVRGTTASNAWAADAIGIANAYDPDTGDDIAKVYGYDDAGNIANLTSSRC